MTTVRMLLETGRAWRTIIAIRCSGCFDGVCYDRTRYDKNTTRVYLMPRRLGASSVQWPRRVREPHLQGELNRMKNKF